MKAQLKKVADQIIVITGASSGIGLSTAKMAAARGARVVLAARSEDALRDIAREITELGGSAAYAVADVAVREFGGFDTWVNNAALAMYGRLTEVTLEDSRRLFDVNFWGTVYGCRVAIPHLRERGGAIINNGSALSERAVPLQGMYVASKHALKGFTDTLRMELEEEGAPISVTLVKPGSIDTPYFQHAKSYMEVAPKPPAPVYDPEVVARTILECAERPVRDVYVGGGGRMIAAMENTPRLADRYMEKAMFRQQRSNKPVQARHNLYIPSAPSGVERGSNYEGHVMKSSAYTKASLNRGKTALAALGLGLAVAGLRYLGGTGDGNGS
ncbi:MAG: SDR family oxidoreductase [Chloroflexota bacterium]|nr:SDR family oxidoreductase [Chloroflexota bacterium]